MKFELNKFKEECAVAIEAVRSDTAKSITRREYQGRELANKLEILLGKYDELTEKYLND